MLDGIYWVSKRLHFRLFWTITLILVFTLSSCRPEPNSSLETITIGLPALEQNALIYIAQQQGLFQKHGLRVVIRDYDSGVTAVNALVENQVDVAGVSEFPFVRALLQQQPLTILTSIDQFENDYLVARKDRGIRSVADLKGKRIGVSLQSVTEFLLGRFLMLNGMRMRDVTLVDLKPNQFISSIADGSVDAIIVWQPYVHQIEKNVPDIVIWPAQSNRVVYGLLVSKKDWLASPDRTTRLLKALSEAELFLVKHPDDARQIVQNYFHYENAYMDIIWPQHQFGLSLDHSMIVAMTDEARWFINQNLASGRLVPDFISAIYLDGLKKVRPDVVEIDQ